MVESYEIVVTGGAGFIGSHLVTALVDKGHYVKVIDNLSRSNTKHIQTLIDNDKILFIDGDIRYTDHVDSVMKGTDYLFHLAATNINRSVRYPDESLDVNLLGSQVVFQSASKFNVKRVIFSSSASVYGEPESLPMSETSSLNPITPYCVAKLSSELLLQYYSRKGLKYNILRYFNVYGINQKVDAYYTSVIILFVKRLLNGLPPIINGSGEQTMDFVSVKDIVHANILTMESQEVNEIFNVGTNISTSVSDLANILIQSLKKKITPTFSGRKSIVTRRRADISKIKKLEGYIEPIHPKEGLFEVANDIKSNPENY